jgi:hypothetical protein
MQTYNATTASLQENIAIGPIALQLYNNTVGSVQYNTVIGSQAMQLYSNTTGTVTENVAVGRNALRMYANTTQTAQYNVAIGASALAVNQASNNTAVGYGAGLNWTTGTRNTMIGSGAGTAAATSGGTGTDNIAIGNSALGTITSANYSVAIGSSDEDGYPAMYRITSGSTNVGIGAGALARNYTGGSNVAVGYQSLANNAASNNVAIGRAAGKYNTGEGNVFIGVVAGTNNTGSNNVCVGQDTGYGYSATATGSSNTLIGTTAGFWLTSGAKNTILGRYNGNQLGLDIRTASNHIVLSDGDGNVRLYHDGNVSWYSSTTTNAYHQVLSPTTGAYLATAHPTGAGSGYSYHVFSYDVNVIGSISQSGTTAVTYATTSDYRLKENVAPMTGALAKVAQLKPVTYKWKSDGSAGQGFIAHELQAIVPDCVTGEKDAVDENGKPKYQGVDTSFLVATLTAAIQELKAEVDSLKQQLASR